MKYSHFQNFRVYYYELGSEKLLFHTKWHTAWTKKKHLRDARQSSTQQHCNNYIRLKSKNQEADNQDVVCSAELINHHSQGSHGMMLSGAICRGTDFYKDDMFYSYIIHLFLLLETRSLYCPGWPETHSNPLASASLVLRL